MLFHSRLHSLKVRFCYELCANFSSLLFREDSSEQDLLFKYDIIVGCEEIMS